MSGKDLGEVIIGCAMKVHSALGPGLLESAYETCLVHELSKTNDNVKRQVALPVVYDGVELDAGYRIDLLVENSVILELKAVERLLLIHAVQLLSYLRLSNKSLGYLLDFNVVHMRNGIRRVVNNY